MPEQAKPGDGLREVPLGACAQTLSELYATMQGAQMAAQAAANAARGAEQRYDDAAKLALRIKKIDPATVERFDFVKSVALVKDPPA